MNRNNQLDTSPPIPGAAYIRYSSEMQSDSFSLDAQLSQIKEQAERDGVEIVKVFADPAQSAYRKKYRPGINAMREAARLGEFRILYVHKVDRLARRLEWSLEIVHELQSLNISFKAVEQPFDLCTPHLVPKWIREDLLHSFVIIGFQTANRNIHFDFLCLNCCSTPTRLPAPS